jgi:hypothetical protein
MTFSRAMPSIFTIPACEAANRCLTQIDCYADRGNCARILAIAANYRLEI